MQLPVDLLEAYFALLRPAESPEGCAAAARRLRGAIEAGDRDLSDLRVALDPSGSLLAAIRVLAHGGSVFGLGRVFSARDLTGPELGSLLADALGHARSRGATIVIARVDPAALTPAHRAGLEALGFRDLGVRVEFTAAIDDLPDDVGTPIEWRDLDAVGLVTAARVLAIASAGAPDWDDNDDPAELLRGYLDDDQLTSGPDCVHIGFVNDAPVAIAVAQVDSSDGWCRITWMAVVPGARGSGIGRWVHRHGFAMMRAQGGRSYHGGTMLQNQPMIALFRRHGCRETRRLVELEWRRSR